MILRDRHAFKEMLPGVGKRRGCGDSFLPLLLFRLAFQVRLREQLPEPGEFFRSEALPLLLLHFRGRDLSQFVLTRFPDQHPNLPVGGHTSVLGDEADDRLVALLTPLAELVDRLRRDAFNLEATLAAFVETIHNLIT